MVFNSVLRMSANMCMFDEMCAKRERDERYSVARTHKAERLWVFGSFAWNGGL